MTPCRPKSELKRILRDITDGHDFDDHSVQQCHSTLASIIGGWQAELGRLEVAPVKKALLAMANNLRDAATALGGTEDGFHTSLEITVAWRILTALASDPVIGSPDSAREMMGSLRRSSEHVSNACMSAAADLPKAPDRRGQKAKTWYDSFTALLLHAAKTAGVRPTLHMKDDHPAGWLLKGARELETFLPKMMRSPSEGARYKRIERSKRNLKRNLRG